MNRERKFVILTVFIAVSIFIIYIFIQCQSISKEFEPGSKNPDNPSKGYYRQTDVDDIDDIAEYINEVKIFLLAYDIYEFRNEPISEESLEKLRAFLEEIKKYDVKCIFRAAYGFDRMESNDCDSILLIEEHIEQIAPILNEYKEQIYCVQAGFFGPWGEWHSSVYLEGEDEVENRNWLINELLENLSEDIIINVRRPQFIRQAKEAGIDIKRVGFHNDGLLASDSDLGTYYDRDYDRKEELNWLKENVTTGINGGEMPKVNEYSSAENAVKEFYDLRISYLNSKYNEEVYKSWKNEKINGQNAYEYISNRLGYRLYISKVKSPKVINDNIFKKLLNIKVELSNEGFAPVSNNFEFEWVLKDTGGKTYFFEAEQNICEVEAGNPVEFKFPVKQMDNIEVAMVGIRISESVNSRRKTVELINDSIKYQGGINYFLEIDSEGNVSIY